MARYTPYASMGTPTAYAFGGGSIGGPNVWDFSSGIPQLSGAASALGTLILPAGALSRQEIRNRQDVQQILRSGRPYVEAPTQYVLQGDRRGLPKYVDPITGRSMGTMAAEWAGSETPVEERVRRQKNREAGLNWTGSPKKNKKQDSDESEEKSQEKQVPATAMGVSGTPLAFTGFGSTAGISPALASPFAGGFGMLTGFGQIPNFPFSNY